jgi:hypothetical protein
MGHDLSKAVDIWEEGPSHVMKIYLHLRSHGIRRYRRHRLRIQLQAQMCSTWIRISSLGKIFSPLPPELTVPDIRCDYSLMTRISRMTSKFTYPVDECFVLTSFFFFPLFILNNLSFLASPLFNLN